MSNNIKYFLFLLALIPLSVLAKEECHTFIKNLPSKRNDPAVPYSLYYKSSGLQGRLDLGNKTLCELDDTMRYYVIHDINGAPNTKGWRQAETGICVPSYCDKEVLENEKDGKELLQKLAQVNNWPIGMNIALHDPNHNDYRGPLYYALINLFYGLVGLCVASTVIQFITRFAENRKSKGPVKKDYSVWLFKSFDVVGNLKSLWQTAEESGQSDHLSMFGFVRLLAIIWVISFHCRDRNLEMFRYPGGATTHPQTDRFIGMGDIAPGYFFFMGGFLAVYTIASKAARATGSGLVGYIMDIVHRLFKIYPGACVAILMYWIVMPGLINGPLWTRYIGAIQVCEERWRDKFTLQDNLTFQPFDHCASWTWYIDVDFQVYPTVAFLAYLFIQHKYLKYFVYLSILAMIRYSINEGLQMIHEVERTGRNPKELWYGQPRVRCFEILIGAFFGLQYYEYAKLKLKSNLISMWERYADFRYISIVAGAYINYYTFFTDAPQAGWTNNEWEYIKRFYISIGTALLFVPLANDSASIFKAIMNLRIFQILGKLCFGAYLLHWPLLLAANYTVEKIPDRYDHMALREKIYENLILSFIAAFVYYLVLEKPLLNIEAHFSKRGGERKPVNYVTIDLDAGKNLVGYKMISEDLDESAMHEQDYSVMEASIMEENPKRMEISSPISPGQSTRGNSSFLTSKKSVRSYQQFDNQSMRDGGDIEMGKYEDRDENNKSKYSVVNTGGYSPTSHKE